MAATPKSVGSDSLNGSWVEVSSSLNERLSHCATPVTKSNADLPLDRILLEVQNQLFKIDRSLSGHSNHSTTTSNNCNYARTDTPNSITPCSPQSPFYIEDTVSPMEMVKWQKELERNKNLSTDWIWYWKQDAMNTVEKKNINSGVYHNEKKQRLNLRQWAMRRGIFSKEVLSILLLTNILSVFLGVGLGYTALIRRML